MRLGRSLLLMLTWIRDYGRKNYADLSVVHVVQQSSQLRVFHPFQQNYRVLAFLDWL